MMLILLQKPDDTQIPPPESTRPSRLWSTWNDRRAGGTSHSWHRAAREEKEQPQMNTDEHRSVFICVHLSRKYRMAQLGPPGGREANVACRLPHEGSVWSSGFSLPRSVQREGWTPNLRALHFHALWVCAGTCETVVSFCAVCTAGNPCQIATIL